MACFRCRETGSMICDGHCGLCADQEDGPELADGHPSERDHAEEAEKKEKTDAC